MVNSQFPPSRSRHKYWQPGIYSREKTHNHSLKKFELSKENLGSEGLGLQEKSSSYSLCGCFSRTLNQGPSINKPYLCTLSFK